MGRRHKRDSIVMDLTPLIDVVFLLLIFFLVTTSFKKEQFALNMKLPKAEEGTGQSPKSDFLNIELTENAIAVNGKTSSFDELPNSFKELKKTALINLRVDSSVRYDRLVKVLDLLQQNKLENISLITDKVKK